MLQITGAARTTSMLRSSKANFNSMQTHLSRVVEQQPVLFERPELEPHVDGVVGLHLGQPDVRVLGGEGHGVVDGGLGVGGHQDGVHRVVQQLAGGGEFKEFAAVHDQLLKGTLHVDKI